MIRKTILICIIILALFYLGSRLQMKAWLQEFDLHFREHYKQFIKPKTDEKGKEI
jgi:hypothetical protein